MGVLTMEKHEEEAKTMKKAIGIFYKYPEIKKYISQNGKQCFRICSSIDWFFYICNQLNIKPKWIDDFYFVAIGYGFSLEWIENDCVLVLE